MDFSLGRATSPQSGWFITQLHHVAWSHKSALHVRQRTSASYVSALFAPVHRRTEQSRRISQDRKHQLACPKCAFGTPLSRKADYRGCQTSYKSKLKNTALHQRNLPSAHRCESHRQKSVINLLQQQDSVRRFHPP